MLKRTMLVLLALVMVAACVPGVQAQGMPEISMAMAEQVEGMALPGRHEVMSQQMGETAWVLPEQSVYGRAVVVGDVMRLPVQVSTKGITAKCELVFLIYPGTYESGALQRKPVYGDRMDIASDAGNIQETMYWNTNGFEAGDYTVVFGIMGSNGKVQHAIRADLYLSDVEIPLNSIDMYIVELDSTPDAVTVARDATFSVVPFYEPYHTTSNRDYILTGDGLTMVPCYIPGITERYSVENLRSDAVTMYCSGCTDTVQFEIVDQSQLAHFEKSSAHICKNHVVPVHVVVPDTVSKDEKILVSNMNTIAAELKSIENQTLNIYGLEYGGGLLTLCYGNSWDSIDLEVGDHVNKEEVQKPTCTDRGYVRNTCVHCGYYTETILDPLGHALDKETEVVLTAPTATRDGESQGFCTRCNKEVRQTVSRIFTDTRGDRFYSDAVDYCYANKIINGVTDHLFKPASELNRAMLVTMLYRYAGKPEVTAENAYTDVPAGKYYTDAVAWATEAKIVKGFPDGTFKPMKPITREQFVTMIFRFVETQNKDNGQRNDLAGFEDRGAVSKFAAEAMQWAVANKVMNGVTKTEIRPKNSATRAQTATMLYRVIVNILTENS